MHPALFAGGGCRSCSDRTWSISGRIAIRISIHLRKPPIRLSIGPSTFHGTFVAVGFDGTFRVQRAVTQLNGQKGVPMRVMLVERVSRRATYAAWMALLLVGLVGCGASAMHLNATKDPFTVKVLPAQPPCGNTQCRRIAWTRSLLLRSSLRLIPARAGFDTRGCSASIS